MIAGLIGLYLLWTGFRFASIFFLVEHIPGEEVAIGVAVGTAILGLALLYLAWRLIRPRPQP